MLKALALQSLLQEAGRSNDSQSLNESLNALKRWAAGINEWANVGEERIRAIESELAGIRRFMDDYAQWARDVEARLQRLENSTARLQ